jgi:AcrR family transcriptional regulator
MNKKDKILEVMLRLIKEQGIQATPMAQIAKEAGVAAGTIYHHFASKEQLVNELFLRVKKEFSDLLASKLSVELGYKDKFWVLWKSLYYYYTQNPLAFNFSAQLGHSPMISDDIKNQAKQYYQPIIDFFAEGISLGILKPMDSNLIGELVYGSVASTVQLYFEGKTNITLEILEQAIEYSWDGISIK